MKFASAGTGTRESAQTLDSCPFRRIWEKIRSHCRRNKSNTSNGDNNNSNRKERERCAQSLCEPLQHRRGSGEDHWGCRFVSSVSLCSPPVSGFFLGQARSAHPLTVVCLWDIFLQCGSVSHFEHYCALLVSRVCCVWNLLACLQLRRKWNRWIGHTGGD